MAGERIILGIDPGTTIMGYGLITVTGNKIKMLALGVLKLNKYDDHALRLKVIFERVIGLIEEYHPDELAIEAPFFGKNVQSMLKLGRAQGVAIAAALSRSILHSDPPASSGRFPLQPAAVFQSPPIHQVRPAKSDH